MFLSVALSPSLAHTLQSLSTLSQSSVNSAMWRSLESSLVIQISHSCFAIFTFLWCWDTKTEAVVIICHSSWVSVTPGAHGLSSQFWSYLPPEVRGIWALASLEDGILTCARQGGRMLWTIQWKWLVWGCFRTICSRAGQLVNLETEEARLGPSAVPITITLSV